MPNKTPLSILFEYASRLNLQVSLPQSQQSACFYFWQYESIASALCCVKDRTQFYSSARTVLCIASHVYGITMLGCQEACASMDVLFSEARPVSLCL